MWIIYIFKNLLADKCNSFKNLDANCEWKFYASKNAITKMDITSFFILFFYLSEKLFKKKIECSFVVFSFSFFKIHFPVFLLRKKMYLYTICESTLKKNRLNCYQFSFTCQNLVTWRQNRKRWIYFLPWFWRKSICFLFPFFVIYKVEFCLGCLLNLFFFYFYKIINLFI